MRAPPSPSPPTGTLLARLLHAGGRELLQDHGREVLLGPVVGPRLGGAVDELVVLVDRQHAVRRQAVHRERSRHPDLPVVLVGLVVEVLVIGPGRDGSVDLMLPSDARLPPQSMRLDRLRRPVIVVTGRGQSVPPVELKRFRKRIGKAVAQFLVRAFLAVDARHFLDPADPPFAAMLHDRGVLHVHSLVRPVANRSILPRPGAANVAPSSPSVKAPPARRAPETPPPGRPRSPPPSDRRRSTRRTPSGRRTPGC